MTREAILEEARRLSPDDRVQLIDQLWATMSDEDALALTPAQEADLNRRIAEDDAGLADRDMAMETEAAYTMAKRLGRLEGLLVGVSAAGATGRRSPAASVPRRGCRAPPAQAGLAKNCRSRSRRHGRVASGPGGSSAPRTRPSSDR